MTATYDSELSARLCSEARKQYVLTEEQGYGVQAGTMHDIADQLEAAQALIVEQASALSNATGLIADGRLQIDALTAQRDAWRQQAVDNGQSAQRIHEEREARVRDIDRMRPVVDTAEQWRDHVYAGRSATSDGVRICDSPIIAAVDAYRAAKAGAR